MTSVRETYIRGIAQTVGALAVVAGIIGWITGWRHGHSVITLGLIVYLSTLFTPRLSLSRSWGALELMRAEKSAGEDALEHVESAVGGFRKYANKRPGEARYLANALDKQWNLLHELDRHEDALPVIQEAVETWRQVVAGEPYYREQLARSLNHAAVTLSQLDREDEAIPANEEAIVLTRSLIAGHEELLALNLSNLVIALQDRERWEQAVPVAQEAYATYRRLMTTRPELLARTALAAEQLTKAHDALGEFEPAVVAGEQALTLLEELAVNDLEWLNRLVTSIEGQAFRLHRVGRSDDARRLELKGVALREKFSDQ
jgi:tetratricopeptide (TPR) repeat protein